MLKHNIPIHTWKFLLGSSCWWCWCIPLGLSQVQPLFLGSFWGRHWWRIIAALWSRVVGLCWTVRPRVWGCWEGHRGGGALGQGDGHISGGYSSGLSCSVIKQTQVNLQFLHSVKWYNIFIHTKIQHNNFETKTTPSTLKCDETEFTVEKIDRLLKDVRNSRFSQEWTKFWRLY